MNMGRVRARAVSPREREGQRRARPARTRSGSTGKGLIWRRAESSRAGDRKRWRPVNLAGGRWFIWMVVMGWMGGVKTDWPDVAFEVFEFDAQGVVLGVGQHVDVLVAQPEFHFRIAEAALVVVPVAVEVLALLAVVVAALDHLHVQSTVVNWWAVNRVESAAGLSNPAGFHSEGKIEMGTVSGTWY